jgi:tryptophan halogenase
MKDGSPVRRIVIVGGGTAGWMAAAALARFAGKGRRIVLVESDAIGIVGVGEATIPPLVEFNHQLGIDEDEFLRETNATFKLGIEFSGWVDGSDRYFHQFGHIGRPLNGIPLYQCWLKHRNDPRVGPLSAYSMSATAAYEHRFAHPSADPNSPLSQIAYAYHFDAAAYGRLLRRYAERLGVERIEGKIVGIEQDGESGFVTAVNVDDDRRIRGDLFIDCSGFRSLLLGQKLEVEFEDWSHWLPCDRAIAVPSEPDPTLFPYTRAIAQDCGWQWRIPLQHRTGNGYVYSNAHISTEDAEEVLLKSLGGKKLAEPNRLSFKAGRRRKMWEANVIAVGLSSGFLEPLESTSIHLIQHGIQKLLTLFPGRGISAVERDEYNRHMVGLYEPIRDFIILHFKATRRAGAFWDYVRNMAIPDTLAHKLDLFREHGRVFRYNEELFDVPSWVAVLLGQQVVPMQHDPLLDSLPDADVVRAMLELRKGYHDTALRLPAASDYVRQRVAA